MDFAQLRLRRLPPSPQRQPWGLECHPALRRGRCRAVRRAGSGRRLPGPLPYHAGRVLSVKPADPKASSAQALAASEACPKPRIGLLVPLARFLGLGPKYVLATSVKPSDLSMSQLITPDLGEQIRCGKVPLKMVKDVVFSQPRLANGAVKSLALDLQRPASGGPRPLVIFVPGGGFFVAPKEATLDLRTFVAEFGFVVASIQYRTVQDGATYRDSVADVKAAIRYLRAHANTYGIDPDHVAVWGQSAGGYLAAMAGVTGNMTEFNQSDDRESSSVQAVVDEFGPADLGKTAADFDPTTQAGYARPDNPIAAYLLGSPGRIVDSPVAAGPANPASYISRSTPPFLLFKAIMIAWCSPVRQPRCKKPCERRASTAPATSSMAPAMGT